MAAITFDITPMIKQAIDEAVAKQMQHEPDYRCWWTTKDVVERYGITQPWLKAHITDVPKFQHQLEGFAFNYGGRIGWRFEPAAFSQFMREHFREIAKEATQ